MAFKYSSDITTDDLLRIEIFSVAIGCDPLDALQTWMSESTLLTTADNPNGHASGIFQVMPDILKGLGYKPQILDTLERSAAFRQESFCEQVRWAQRFYLPYKGKLKNKTLFYTATFLPADIDYVAAGGPDTVLVQKDGRRGWAFTANAGFDANHDYKITASELDAAIDRACHSSRWYEIRDRMIEQLRMTPKPTPTLPEYDLSTKTGVQSALAKLGYNPGPIDGIFGPLTVLAIKSFQASHGLDVDGIFGPRTRAALKAAIISPT